MAKDSVEDELNEDEKSTEAVENSKKKAPKPKKEGGTPIVLIAGGAFAGVIVIILSVIIGVIIANMLFPKIFKEGEAPEPEKIEKTAEEIAKEETEKLAENFPDNEEYDKKSLLLSGEEWYSFKSDKITTNVKGSVNTFVATSIMVDYRAYFKDELISKGFLLKGEGDSPETPVPPTVDTTSALYQKLKQIISSKMNDFIGMHTEGELQQMRTDEVLKFSDRFKEYLKPTFKDFGLVIGEVYIVEFMFARQ
jgi:uncharacterized membrane protein